MTQHNRLFTGALIDSARLPYLLYLPPGYDDDSAWQYPFILFLHGLGERGDDLERLKKHGLPKILDKRDDFPFVVISPQCPDGSWWQLEIEALRALLDHALATYKIDPTRVYLTGLSMGGFGTWTLATKYPQYFAAIAPICGGGIPVLAERLATTPIWAFHGAKDDHVPLQLSEVMVNAVRTRGGSVEFTVYPDAAHDSWTVTYDNPALYDWFLQHQRGASG